ncbi:MAG: tyrosine-type recombinase/integrase [Dysgonamonadaceae bacterium]|jgi:integrase|nr:tyrosine-type recombinase/integrase [Dysgonamonadaceae bacterium]
MNKKFNSIYGYHIKKFIEMKRAFGFKCKTEVSVLLHIDALAVKRKETLPGITKEFAEEWRQKRLHESENYRYHRVRCLAQFSSYLNDLSIQSYIPKLLPYPKSSFIPYIYSAKEISSLFNACDELRLASATKDTILFSFPVLFRLLYATGLRISEALALRNEDVNLEENYLLVKDCKNGKERIIPISDSLSLVCKEYVKYRKLLPSEKVKSGYFFVKLDGSKICSLSAVQNWFKKCLKKVGIHYVGRNHGPRLHDLRHTFAVHSLTSMIEAGIDLYVSLPILSNYLGHQSLDATEHYVRLTANMYPDLVNEMNMVCLDVFPKFRNYETD